MHEVPAGAGPHAGGVRSRNPHADLMFIGEGPGFYEDKQGSRSWARRGQLLNRMLGEIGFQREDAYIANVVMCRPPGNRDPMPDEIEACTPWLMEKLELIDPRIVVTLGNFATRFVLDTSSSISRLRGQRFRWRERTVIPTFHPAAVLHGGGENSRQMQSLREDFREIKAALDGSASPPPSPDEPSAWIRRATSSGFRRRSPRPSSSACSDAPGASNGDGRGDAGGGRGDRRPPASGRRDRPHGDLGGEDHARCRARRGRSA